MKKQQLFDIKAGTLLALGMLFPIVNRFFQGILSIVNIDMFSGIITYPIIIFLWLKLLYKFRSLIFGYFLKVYLLIVTIFYISYVLHPETQIYFEEYSGYLTRVFLIFIPISIIISKIDDFSFFLDKVKLIAKLGTIIGVIGTVFNILPYWERLTYSTYLMGFPIFLYYHFRKKGEFFSLVFTLLGVSLVLLYGGRMNLIIILVYFLLFELFENYGANKLKFVINVSFLMAFILLSFLVYEDIINFLANSVFISPVESRNLNVILSNEVFDFETRVPIYNTSMDILQSLGMQISGIFGDRYLVRSQVHWIEYPHNIFLEVLLSFGWLLGGILICLTMYKTIKSFIVGSGTHKSTILAFFCLVILRLMVSGSFVIEDNFYLFIGIILNNPNKKRTTSISIDKEVCQ